MSSRDNLTLFGTSFQTKIIASLITSRKFVEQIQDILEVNYFESQANRWLVKQIKEYFLKYKKPPTLEAVKVLMGELQDDILKVSVVDQLREAYKHMEADDLEFVQEKTLEFCKNQKMKAAIIKSVDLLEQNEYEEIKTLVDEAMKAGTEKDVGHIYTEMIAERYSESARECVATPWEVLNDLTQGGLSAGELGVIVAPAGIGKSWVLSAIGANSVKEGKTIVHYSLELNEAYVGLRYDSVVTGIANQNLKFHQDEVEQKVGNVKGELIIKYFPTKTASVQTMAAHLERIKTLGGDFDMIVVDYADIMRDVGQAKEMRHALGNIYEDLRGLAGEMGVPIWTASQANRSALEEDVIQAEKVAESYAKVMTADFVMSLSRKVEDKIANTGRFHIIKNRFGPDGMTFPAKINTNNGNMEMYERTTVEGKEQQKNIDNREEFARKELAQKYKDLG